MKNKIKAVALSLIPLAITACGLAFTPGETPKVMVAWAFLMGIGQAVAATPLVRALRS